MNSLENSIVQEIRMELETPKHKPPYTVINVDSDSTNKRLELTTYSLGFRLSEMDTSKGRKALTRAASGMADALTLVNSTTPHKYLFDTLVIRSIEYKILEDSEEVSVRAVFLKEGKPIEYKEI